jgi:surfactin family lipopeptide synthetase C
MSERSANIEDIYDLSPLQQGLLFEVLRNPEAGVYFMQSGRRMEGLDVPAYRHAWQQLAQRHAVLRTSFHWEGLDKPVQVVHRVVTVPIVEEDWRAFSPAEQEQRLHAYLRDDRRRGFNLSEAPLLRVALFRLCERDYQMIWSRHHICLDGWSGPLMTKEIAALY